MKSLVSLGSSKAGAKDGPSEAAMIRVFGKRVQATLRRGSRLIDVVVYDEDPARARTLCQSLLSEYTRMNFEQRLEASRPANQYLLQEADRLKDKLEKSEQRLQAYREEKQAVSLEDKQNIIVDTLKDLNLKLGAARTERVKLESDLAQVERCNGKTDELLAVASIASSQDVLALKARLSEQAGSLANLKERYGQESPRYAQAESQMQNVKADLETNVRQVAAQIKGACESARATEKKLLDALRDQEQQALQLNRILIQYNVLSRDVDSDRALYQAVLSQLKESQVIQGINEGNIRVVSAASLPDDDQPAKPRKLQSLAIGLALGLMLGGGLGLALHFRRTPLMGVVEAEEILNLPAVGAIPKAGLMGKGLVVTGRPNGPVAEAFRSLRTAVNLRSRGNGTQSILFAGAMPGEGKTFCAANFAASLAQEGLRTLLIDADLRRPGLGAYFPSKNGAAGLADVLRGQADLSQAAQGTEVPHLSFLPAGTAATSAAELLGTQALRDLLAAAMGKYDRVVIDSPAVLPVSDGLLVAAQVSAVCLVVRARQTPWRLARRAERLLAAAAGRAPLGFVFNRMRGGPGNYYSAG